MRAFRDGFVAVENRLHAELVRHGITALRIAVGAIFLGFGVLKFFPGISPAQNLTVKTVGLLSFHLVPGMVGLVAIATLECFIGLCLLANRGMRLAVWLLAIELVGILAPVVLLTGRLFSGPHNAPTLEGQYVLKDIILIAAGMVIVAGTFRGGRLVRDEPGPEPEDRSGRAGPDTRLAASRRLEIVLGAVGGGRPVDEVCADHGISRSDYHAWHEAILREAARRLEEHSGNGTGS